jgi:hypothetical protein
MLWLRTDLASFWHQLRGTRQSRAFSLTSPLGAEAGSDAKPEEWLSGRQPRRMVIASGFSSLM